jgi:hypothetical protein
MKRQPYQRNAGGVLRPDINSQRWRIEMKKIVLAMVSLLFASGMAFAGSDHFGSDFIPAASSYPTAGSHAMVSGGANAVDLSGTKSSTDSAAEGNATSGMPAPGYGQGIWGH